MATIKVDGTKGPTGVENISIIIQFFNERSLKVAERLLALSSTDSGDAKSITDVILAKLIIAGLTSSKILSSVYDGASVMTGHCGGIQRLLQERENRKTPYLHCLNHQLRHVVVHTMSVEQANNNYLHVCGCLHFFRKPIVALHYNGEKLKRLLEQRWTGHLATVTAVLNFFQHITSLLQETVTSRACKAETRIKTSGLLQEVQE